MTVSLRRVFRKTRRALRRSAPAAMALCLLAALVGATLVGVFSR
ncbi:hypothetical protein [Arthrobacter methylotrophus]